MAKKFYYPLPKAKNYDESWSISTPSRISDGNYERDPINGDGSLLVIENVHVCRECGGLAVQRMSYVWRETKRPDLKALGIGASVKHYYTKCQDCGAEVVS